MKIELVNITETQPTRDHGKVEFSELKTSLEALGLLEPLIINQNNKLLCGRRRYQAAKELGWKDIEVKIIETKDVLEEIDISIHENMKRKQLTPLEEGQALLERKRIYERLYPETKQYSKEMMSDVRQRLPHVDSFVTDTAGKFGISERTIRRNIQAAELVEECPELAEENTVNRIIRKHHIKENSKKIDAPTGKYRILYADPPWCYGDKRDGHTTGAEDHYESMTIKELCNLPIMALTEKNAVLFLWVTSPILDECFEVVKAWGFEYKTSFVWDKIKHNMGHYNSVRHELLLICTKGSCLPDTSKLYDSVVSIERTKKHSEKPEEFRKIIECLYTHGNKIELFGRKKVEGWVAWGLEA